MLDSKYVNLEASSSIATVSASQNSAGLVAPAAQQWLAIAAQASCNICGSAGMIELPADTAHVEDPATLRESLACRGCGGISRDRALAAGLAGMLGEREALAAWAPRKHLRMFETSGYRGHPRFLAELFEYYNLPYAPPPDGDSGAAIEARAGADLQDLQFPAGFFDVVMTAEVLEHVPDEQRAIREIARVLRNGGHLVLEVPYVHEWERTLVRVNRWHGRDVYLYPPEYHAENTLVYRIYGRDLLAHLAAAGLAVAHLVLDIPELAVTRQTVIVATKGRYLDFGGFRVSSPLVSAAPART
jgi:SAM-dependent methyltransferase